MHWFLSSGLHIRNLVPFQWSHHLIPGIGTSTYTPARHTHFGYDRVVLIAVLSIGAGLGDKDGKDGLVVWPSRLDILHCGREWGSGLAQHLNPFSTHSQLYLSLPRRPVFVIGPRLHFTRVVHVPLR